MSRRVNNPGCWPLEMRAVTAAAYCDEPSPEAFLSKVQRGMYPQPMRQKGALAKWHRSLLDSYIARRHGLTLDAGNPIEDAASLI